ISCRSADFSPLPAISGEPEGSGLKSALLGNLLRATVAWSQLVSAKRVVSVVAHASPPASEGGVSPPASSSHRDGAGTRSRDGCATGLTDRFNRTPLNVERPTLLPGAVRFVLTRHPRLSSNQRTGIAVSIWFLFYTVAALAVTYKIKTKC